MENYSLFGSFFLFSSPDWDIEKKARWSLLLAISIIFSKLPFFGVTLMDSRIKIVEALEFQCHFSFFVQWMNVIRKHMLTIKSVALTVFSKLRCWNAWEIEYSECRKSGNKYITWGLWSKNLNVILKRYVVTFSHQFSASKV